MSNHSSHWLLTLNTNTNLQKFTVLAAIIFLSILNSIAAWDQVNMDSAF